VVDTTPGDDAQTRDQIGQVTADLVSEITTPGDVLGIGWARVVLAMAAKLHGRRSRRMEPAQLNSPRRPHPAEPYLMRTSGVHADLSGVLLDAQGGAMETPLSGRIIAITAPQLRRIPEVIGIAYGLDKASAARPA
jgi:DNA-binding transcriptional regulator LsrR (DeoR family)